MFTSLLIAVVCAFSVGLFVGAWWKSIQISRKDEERIEITDKGEKWQDGPLNR